MHAHACKNIHTDRRADKTYDRVHACTNINSHICVHTHTHTHRGATGLVGMQTSGDIVRRDQLHYHDRKRKIKIKVLFSF